MDYSRIIYLPHRTSRIRPNMSLYNRAAQFAPFAALKGYEEAVSETARLTETFNSDDEDRMNELSMKLDIIREHILEQPDIDFTYFIPDKRKSGGSYAHKNGKVRRIDEYNRTFILTDGSEIKMDNVVEMFSQYFEEFV